MSEWVAGLHWWIQTGCVVRIQCWLVGELAGGLVIGSLVPGLLVAG